ncbi:MAG: hypothetical protein N3F09_09180 [Bacteroidia bacterium]|nr:hypothetical protein [Bacteroidia bacterium]
MQGNFWIILLIFWSIISTYSQSWEFDEVIQFIRPRIFTRFYGFQPYTDNPQGAYYVMESGATFPVKHKFEVGLSKNFLDNLLEKKWDKIADIRAYTLFGALQGGVRNQTILDRDVLKNQNYFFQGSFGGLHLTKKLRILFWQFQGHLFAEPRHAYFPGIYSGIAGIFRLYGLRKYLYYGLAVGYFKNYPIPIPFFGGQYPLGDHWNLVATLPYRIGMQFVSNGFSVITGLRPSGSVFLVHEPYRNFTFYSQGLAYCQSRIRLGKGIFLYMEAAWAFYGQFFIPEYNYSKIQRGIYVQGGLTFTGGKTLLEKLADHIFK